MVALAGEKGERGRRMKERRKYKVGEGDGYFWDWEAFNFKFVWWVHRESGCGEENEGYV